MLIDLFNARGRLLDLFIGTRGRLLDLFIGTRGRFGGGWEKLQITAAHWTIDCNSKLVAFLVCEMFSIEKTFITLQACIMVTVWKIHTSAEVSLWDEAGFA